MKRFIPILSAFALFFLMSCQKEVSSPTNNLAMPGKAQAVKSVPFKGFYTTTSELLKPPPILQQRVTGTGEATYLGESNFVAVVTVNLTTPPPFALSGTAVFTAANGDQFYTQFSGANTPNGDGTATGVLHHTIVGGTGRFENATGSITAVVHVDPTSPTNTVDYSGEINFN